MPTSRHAPCWLAPAGYHGTTCGEGTLIDNLAYIAFDELAEQTTGSGPVWATESADLDVTLLTWRAGADLAAHVNDEVDVLLIGVAGLGDVVVDDETFHLEPGRAVDPQSRRSFVALQRALELSQHPPTSSRAVADRWPTGQRIADRTEWLLALIAAIRRSCGVWSGWSTLRFSDNGTMSSIRGVVV